jgi:hypothetical protein
MAAIRCRIAEVFGHSCHPARTPCPRREFAAFEIDGATRQRRSFGRKLLGRKAGIVIDAKLHHREPNTY